MHYLPKHVLPRITVLSLAIALLATGVLGAAFQGAQASSDSSPLLESWQVQAQETPDDEMHTYTLHSRWTAIAWLGEDGIEASEALSGTGENEAGNDVSDDIASIWLWDAAEQEWQAYFPVDLPGASDFETLTRFEVYWVALADDVDMVEWEIEMPAAQGYPSGYPTLPDALEAYIEGEGQTYSGPCLEAEAPEDIGSWCSLIETQTDTEATVSFGPTFSEFAVSVTLERQAGEGWVVTDEDPVGVTPTATATGTSSPTATGTATATPTTPAATNTATATPTTPTATATATATPTTPTATATATETP